MNAYMIIYALKKYTAIKNKLAQNLRSDNTKYKFLAIANKNENDGKKEQLKILGIHPMKIIYIKSII